jgi:hypothetical protein
VSWHNDQESNTGGCQRTYVKSKAHLGSSLEGQLGLAEIISFWECERYEGDDRHTIKRNWETRIEVNPELES